MKNIRTKQHRAAFKAFKARQWKIEAATGKMIRAAGRHLTQRTAQSVRT